MDELGTSWDECFGIELEEIMVLGIRILLTFLTMWKDRKGNYERNGKKMEGYNSFSDGSEKKWRGNNITTQKSFDYTFTKMCYANASASFICN